MFWLRRWQSKRSRAPVWGSRPFPILGSAERTIGTEIVDIIHNPAMGIDYASSPHMPALICAISEKHVVRSLRACFLKVLVLGRFFRTLSCCGFYRKLKLTRWL